jgi:hypothetical protein
MPTVERITLDNVDEAFTYQPWTSEQIEAGTEIRAALVEATKVILRRCKETPLRTRAVNNLIDARMLANACITFDGRF